MQRFHCVGVVLVAELPQERRVGIAFELGADRGWEWAGERGLELREWFSRRGIDRRRQADGREQRLDGSRVIGRRHGKPPGAGPVVSSAPVTLSKVSSRCHETMRTQSSSTMCCQP